MSKATHTMDDVDTSAWEPTESTVDPFATTPHLGAADGKSTVDVSEVEGGDRVTESITNGVFDFHDTDTTSEPTHEPSTVSSREKLETAETKKRTRRTKAQIEADEKAEADAKAKAKAAEDDDKSDA